MSEWQPIETAPDDGTPFLGFWQYVYPGDKSRTCGTRVVEYDGEWWFDGEDSFQDKQFREVYSHWMPLPEPPK